jgi:hypothetical protein
MIAIAYVSPKAIPRILAGTDESWISEPLGICHNSKEEQSVFRLPCGKRFRKKARLFMEIDDCDKALKENINRGNPK